MALLMVMTSCTFKSCSKRTGNFELTMILKAEGLHNEANMNSITEIVKNRLLNYGIPEENITIGFQNDEISLRVEHADDPERLALLVSTTGKLEFWETFDNTDIYSQLEDANKKLAEIFKLDSTENIFSKNSQEADSAEMIQQNDTISLLEKVKSNKTEDKSFIEYTKENPLFSCLHPNVTQDVNGGFALGSGPNVGYGLITDTAKINKMLSIAIDKNVFRRDVKFLWEMQPFDDAKTMLWLIAIKTNIRQENAALDGSVITKATQDNDPSGNVVVSLEMNTEGAHVWKRLTSENIGRNIAIVLDGYVYSYPVVQSEIENGRSQISGNFTKEEAEDIATILTMGKLPCKLKIISSEILEKD